MTDARRLIDKYEIERRLGSGGFATVWLCYDPVLTAHVAIKVLGDIWCADAEVEERFLQEARLLFQINDPRIVKVYTTGVREDGCPYFVMDYADRGSLAERIESRAVANEPYSPREALLLSREIADCLSVVHGEGIIHRDLKPSNILYRADGTLRDGERMMLGDFGVARPIDSASPNTIVAGSPHYMAPEQTEETTAGTVDQRADLYSAAVILYELLAGQVPYPFATISEIRRAQEANQRVPLNQLRAKVPSAVIWLVDQGLQTDPAGRLPSVDAWIGALDTALASLEDSVVPTGIEQTLTSVPTVTIPAATAVESSGPSPTEAGTEPLAAVDPATTHRDPEAVRSMTVSQPSSATSTSQPAAIAPISVEPPVRAGRRWLRWILILILLVALVTTGLAAVSYLFDWPSNLPW